MPPLEAPRQSAGRGASGARHRALPVSQKALARRPHGARRATGATAARREHVTLVERIGPGASATIGVANGRQRAVGA
jgi:hypothetical protein